MTFLLESPLGQTTAPPQTYNRGLLCSLPRSLAREMIGLTNPSFQGWDLWQAFEFSWLNRRGMPQVRMVRFLFDARSSHFIESKSFKLYLHSFQMEKMTEEEVLERLQEDLSKAVRSSVDVRFTDFAKTVSSSGVCLDDLDIEVEEYQVNPRLLRTGQDVVSEKFYTDLFKANCLVTAQPDWATVEIAYRGPQIDPASLLHYLVSYRSHKGLHEQCVEQIFSDLYGLGLTELTVLGRFTRRGGLDINPMRSTQKISPPLGRLVRQ